MNFLRDEARRDGRAWRRDNKTRPETGALRGSYWKTRATSAMAVNWLIDGRLVKSWPGHRV
jgi:hypothetical protein